MLQNELRKISAHFADCERSNDLQSSSKSLSLKSVDSGAEKLYDENNIINKNNNLLL